MEPLSNVLVKHCHCFIQTYLLICCKSEPTKYQGIQYIPGQFKFDGKRNYRQCCVFVRNVPFVHFVGMVFGVAERLKVCEVFIGIENELNCIIDGLKGHKLVIRPKFSIHSHMSHFLLLVIGTVRSDAFEVYAKLFSPLFMQIFSVCEDRPA